ncbi:MAG: alkaline phosphatase family protein [Phycisphaerales bacterium]|jgi:predicted AlkP superfamily pyrophosphatase or phosphodiesterase|nr:alkaline phosphatase family protein [Phycisphaerales bacterium]
MGTDGKTKLLVVQVAALGYELLKRHCDGAEWLGLNFAPIDGGSPGVTCSAQASFRTAADASVHGMVANGLYQRDLGRAMFWEQSAGLVSGERIWKKFRDAGGTVAMLFWQQSMGEDVDILVTPAPIHKHHGGMIQDCYTKPPGLYQHLCTQTGGSFKLRHYWGPLASVKVGNWIADATMAICADSENAPDLCLTYLPTLDYDLQRYGPDDPRSARAMNILEAQLKKLLDGARKCGYELLVFGDYAITPVSGKAVLPNLALRNAGLLETRDVKGMLYPVLPASRAIAVCDHQVAHVYVSDPGDIELAADTLRAVDGIEAVLGAEEIAAMGLGHANSGELLILAEQGKWLGYQWWTDRKQAPDYASHVDIHNKPGFDPCELFFGWPPISISQDSSRIGGSHGRCGPDCEVAWASSIQLDGEISDIVSLARSVGKSLS